MSHPKPLVLGIALGLILLFGCRKHPLPVQITESSALLNELRKLQLDEGLNIVEINLNTLRRVDYGAQPTLRYDYMDAHFGIATTSPDGTVVAGERAIDQGFVVLNSRGEMKWSSNGPFNISHLAVSPDARKIAFENAHGVFYFTIGGGPLVVEEVFRRPPAATQVVPGTTVGWDRTGSRLVFSWQDRITVFDLASRSMTTLAPGFDPSWSPDGKWIGYRSLDGEATIADPAGRESTILARGRKIAGPLHWSPDSRYIIYECPDDSLDKQYVFLENRLSLLIVHRLEDHAECIAAKPIDRGDGYRYCWLQHQFAPEPAVVRKPSVAGKPQ